MSNNEISTIQASAFHDLQNLQSLDISSNNLVRVMDNRLVYTPMIEKIDMAHNNITYIHEFTFTELTALQDLDLSYNQLTSDRFVDFESTMKRLNLANNQYKTFNVSKLEAIGHVNLTLNPWDCTWLVNEFVGKIQEVSGVQLGRPLNVLDAQTIKTNAEDVTCYEYDRNESQRPTTKRFILIDRHTDAGDRTVVSILTCSRGTTFPSLLAFFLILFVHCRKKLISAHIHDSPNY